MKKLTKEIFIDFSIKVHGNKYDYSKVNYKNARSKVIIICPIHGEFEQISQHHIRGTGCSKCAFNRIRFSLKYTQEEFIKRAILIHGDKYDYSKVIYINCRDKIIIICKHHGEFLQTPESHLQGQGCPTCKAEKTSLRCKFTQNEFIQKAIAIHGTKYNYSKVDYKHSQTKVIIICPIHGEFEQTPNNHLRGQNCHICKVISKGESTIQSILDKYNIKYKQEYRIPKIENKLYYDFYLPDYNILIEFHGIQHYGYYPFFHRNGEDDFLKQKNRDDIVRYNAKICKYNYIEFNYKQLKKLSKEQFEEMIISTINHVARRN